MKPNRASIASLVQAGRALAGLSVAALATAVFLLAAGRAADLVGVVQLSWITGAAGVFVCAVGARKADRAHEFDLERRAYRGLRLALVPFAATLIAFLALVVLLQGLRFEMMG